MIALWRRAWWWLKRRRKEDEVSEELAFHLAEEAAERRANGLSEEQAAWAAHRDLGNATLVREDARAVWSWRPLEQLAQDVRYGVRGMARNRLFTLLAASSLALGIGANTAIFSFMDAILLRALPVAEPASLVAVQWRSRPYSRRNGDEFVMRSMDGRTDEDGPEMTGAIFPFPAFERLHDSSTSVFSSLFAHKRVGSLNVSIAGAAEVAKGEYVSGEFFRGLAVVPAAGRLIDAQDDRAGATPVAVLSLGYSQRRFGDAERAVGQPILINNVPFTVAGVAPAEFFGVDPAEAPQVYVPMRAAGLAQKDLGDDVLVDPNYYWVEMMGRLKPGVDLAQAQAALAPPFAQWVSSTADDAERANLPALRLAEGAAGLDSLRRQFSKPLYVLFAMVGLILAIACANTANLLLARAAARTHEMAVRLSLGAGRWRVIRQLLTESVLLATLSGVLGVAVAFVCMRALTQWLANGEADFTLHAELNWRVLLVTLGLSLVCGLVFGLAPALRATRPALIAALRDRSMGEPGVRLRALVPRVSLTQALVVAQIAVSLLLLVAAGLFLRTLANLQGVELGFNRTNVLLFDINAPQAGYPAERTAAFYLDLRRRLNEMPGVRDASLSHASLVRAGRSHPMTVSGQPVEGARVLWTGPRFFQTLRIPIVRGREFADRDRETTLPVAVVSERFARIYFPDADPIGRQLTMGGSFSVGGKARALEVVGVAADVRYGGLKSQGPPVVYIAYAQVPADGLGQVTYALRTEGDPLRFTAAARAIVHDADARVPVAGVRTQAEEIDQTINQEIVFARLCSAFAILALTIACVGLYATMAYAVARRTREIGVRVALGAPRATVTWMVLREVCLLAGVAVAMAIPIAVATSRVVESFLFQMQPNDPQTLAIAASVLIVAALAAGYGPARRAARVDPMTALRHE